MELNYTNSKVEWNIDGENPKVIETDKSVYEVTYLSVTNIRIVDKNRIRNLFINLGFIKLQISSK